MVDGLESPRGGENVVTVVREKGLHAGKTALVVVDDEDTEPHGARVKPKIPLKGLGVPTHIL